MTIRRKQNQVKVIATWLFVLHLQSQCLEQLIVFLQHLSYCAGSDNSIDEVNSQAPKFGN